MKTLLDIWNPERNSPWREFSSLQRRMDRFLDDYPELFSTESGKFSPACDLEETDKHYLITMDAPGMSKDQLDINIHGNTLTVRGEQKEEKREGKGAQSRYERYHGSFERSFTMPEITDAEKIEADYKDGVLRIMIPKAAAAKSKKVQISEGKSGLFSKLGGKSEKREDSGKAA